MHQEQTIRDHATFRAILQAMSRPGTIQQLPAGGDGPLQTLLSTLLDQEVSLAGIDPAAADLAAEVARRTGSRITALEQADFLLAIGDSAAGSLTVLKRGSSDYPETGATVIFLVDGINPEGGAYSLSGPGIKDEVYPEFSGISDKVLPLLAEVNRDFPLGIDAMILDRQGQLTCIPRSTKIGER
ncbi:MAG TPA: phosphonate C-P lyase system protein PhnH [Desulfuromonadales bacterium]|nr:phosphonate C-P lyase system protein PhnH [Desulfuromonadales bacterium]